MIIIVEHIILMCIVLKIISRYINKIEMLYHKSVVQ